MARRLIGFILTLARLFDGAAQGVAYAYFSDPRRTTPSSSPAQAIDEPTQERPDQSGEEGDGEDLPPPRNFTIFVQSENADDPGDPDLLLWNMTVPPEVVAEPERDYLRKVVSAIHAKTAEEVARLREGDR